MEATSSLPGKEIFVLRNLTRGKGVGFFENEGFYPDFIVWIRDADRQRIVFVEPTACCTRRRTDWTSDKAQLHERLRELSYAWRDRSPGPTVDLDAFIVSKTPYLQLRDYYGTGTWSVSDFAERHVLFFESPGYVANLFHEAAADHPV